MKASTLKKMLKGIIVISLLILLGILICVLSQFYPSNRIELPSASGQCRLFAVALDSADGTVLVNASDWPYTLSKPFVLGDANWPEVYASANCYWSKDGTLAVWQVRSVDEENTRYEAAYDYREHRSVDLKQYAWNKKACDEAIAILVLSRGGLNPLSIDIPALNSGMYQK